MDDHSDEINEPSSSAHRTVEQVAENSETRENRLWIYREWIAAGVSLLFLTIGLFFDFSQAFPRFTGSARLAWYIFAYLPVGLPVILRGVQLATKGEVFTEFLLMSIATLGAFYIGEFPEGVAVMLFYTIGELFQGAAVSRAKKSIKALLDVRPRDASVLRGEKFVSIGPENVSVGETIQVKAGERVPLDGTLMNSGSNFNTSALTGESAPAFFDPGQTILAGMISNSDVVDIKVTRRYEDSTLARILSLVQNAQGRKAKTELFIRKFARWYTPVVVFLAAGVTFLPYFWVADYNFDTWLYRALIFLVISCPCALVVAIPLGYFGGIGAGSRNGILFKGSSYLDRLTRVRTVVLDKTGTLTSGVFSVKKVVSLNGTEKEWLPYLVSVEARSTHPIAKAVTEHFQGISQKNVTSVTEVKGHGVKAIIGEKEVLAGNATLMKKFGVAITTIDNQDLPKTLVLLAINKNLVGYVEVGDQLRDDAINTVQGLRDLGIESIILSGDKQEIVNTVASTLKIDKAYGALLPEDKVRFLEQIKRERGSAIAFVGDGINDAPALAVSDVGVAMGGLGSDAAIETADVVIQTDQPSKIVTAIRIGKKTNGIVWQNIIMAFGIKIIVMTLGVWGIASMWEAVFADVGVALLSIVNAIRIQQMKFG
jgi:Cd2+/Zn2+-exporting ATPase